MTSAVSRVDEELEALRAALRAGDRAAVQERLQAIEGALAQVANPLVRGLAYAGVQAELGHADVAIAVVEELLAVMGDDALLHQHLGRHRRQAGDRDGAIAALARSCELDPMRTESWLELGTLLDEHGAPSSAIACYREALRQSPTDFDVWRNLGNSLAALGRFEEAIAAYDTAAIHRPKDRMVLLLRAAAHQATGAIEKANAITPPALKDEIGEVIEVRDDSAPQVLGCRFRSRPEHRDEHRAAASRLLAEARRDLSTLGELGHAESRPRWFFVRQANLVLVCDRDPLRPDHPHRFFDASELVRRSGPHGKARNRSL
jgi:tetratricopeptide (TPR) repeat protein